MRQRVSARDHTFDDEYGIITVGEYIQIIQATTSRTVAPYIELKDPSWVNSLDIIISSGTYCPSLTK